MPGSRTAQFDALVAPHLEVLFRVAYRLVRNTPDAQDLVQDTCMVAGEKLGDLAAADHPARWLLRVLQNRFIDGARRRKRSPLVALGDGADASQLVSDQPSPEELLQQADSEHSLHRAFLQLEDMQRTLLSLRAEGYDLGEIEAITGVGREVLRARLQRARRSLSLRIAEQTSAAPSAHRAGSKP
jgi:RNA polymerase sigma-70 factor (ECF subfamily)